MTTPMIWAHRGASFLAPENTLEAFSLADAMGADGVELDVHLSADGELIVAHDETVDRCTSCTGRLREMTLAQLKELDFSNHKAGYRATRVPTLEEVFHLVRPTRMVVNVELKTTVEAYEGIEEKCSRLAGAMGMSDRVYYSSFNHASLMRLTAIEPGARIAPLYTEFMFEPWKYAGSLGAQAIHPHYMTMVIPGIMRGLEDAGILCNPWTVDGEREIKWMTRLGVNAIITNKPDLARQWVSA